MKKRSLLLGLISLFLAFSANAQIVTKYQQGFETGEAVSYQVTSGSASPVTSLYSSGGRSLKLQHGASETIVLLDTLDFTDNANYTAYYLEFMHICDVDPLTCASATDVAIIEVMHPGESSWHTLTDQDCDFTWGGGSTHFRDYSSFSQRAYDQWMGSTTSNSWWKRERFRLANRINDVSDLSQRKLLVRFRLKSRTAAGATNSGWYLDNISVKCSPESMALPVAKMVAYPDAMSYPSSRATRIEVDLTTSVAAGMCDDSVYIDYQLGRLAPIRRMTMTPVPGHTGRYRSFIPFCGYDTVVYWRMVAMDNTVNHNKTTFPLDESGWQEYKSVRGVEASQQLGLWSTDGTMSSSNIYPFPNKGLHKSQMCYSQAEMQASGYGPGAITQIRFPARSSVVGSNHQRFVVEMRNIPNDYAIHVERKFSTEFHRTVYDSSLSITQNSGTFGVINFQDTFYYAGDGLMVTITSKNTTGNPQALSVSTFTHDANTLGTLYKNYDYNLGSDFDPFNSAYFMNGGLESQRPSFIFNANKNMPLLYDCGISGFITPNDSVTANAVGNNDVTVTLKNYGSQPINAVRIYYSVDNGTSQYYDWTGTLAGGASTNVTINTTQTYSAGYHEMLAWVDDSVTSAGMRYRDHEPLNDTLWTRFVACDGPMSGTRYVGGSTPDYQSLEKFLYAVSLCGVNGPLTVKLAPGTYRPVVFPSIPGTSVSNYVLFEPSSNTGNTSVTFEALNDGNTTTTPYLVNLQQANHIRFNRITFSSSVSATNAVTYQVRMGINSTGCQFNDCNFIEGGNNANLSYTVATALLYSGGCDSLTVTNCQFSRGRAGISLVGPAVDNMAHGSFIHGNKFLHQGVNGVIIRNQVGTVVDSNSFDDVYANSSYVILLQDCAGPTKVTRNTVYVTSGASCLGATGFNGYATDNALIANNMLVSNDDGTSNMLTTPLNIINADYTKVLNNSIKLMAPTRSGIAAATFGGTAINNSMFYNNIVACFDTVNFAFNYIPSTNAINYIGYNIYYTRGPVLNKYDGINCMALTNWQGHFPSDANSQQVDPAYLNSNKTDLRSYSQNVKGHAMPFDEVVDDIFGTERDNVAPCIGAFEFSALPYDFEVIEFVEPFDVYCDAPSAAPIKVVIKNSGINAYDPSTQTTPLQLNYSRTATPGSMVPGFSGMVPINRVIPATDTIIFNTGATLPFLPNGLNDSTYHLTVWFSSQIDPNPANDTTSTTVTARYHAPAPSNVQVNANYGVSTSVTANGGLQTWYSNVYTSSTSHQSEVYWYTSPTSTEPIWRGQTYVTDPLYTDTTFYIRQKRDYPLVKISEVQLKNNMPGVTYPMPLWMNGSTLMAVELTNIGDYPAEMKNDTIYTVSGTSSLNDKIYKFPDVTIQPGQTLVLQYRNSISVDSTVTLGAATMSPQLTSNFAIIYKSKGVIMDAVAFNGVTTQNQWTNAQVPSYVWAGEGITIPDTVQTAGVIRTGWPTGGTPSNSRQYWSLAADNNKMTLGTTNNNLIRFVDNGCEGDVATVQIHLINLPDVDLVVDSLDVPSGCGLGINTLSVMLYNRGALASNQVVVHYEAVSNPLFPGQSISLQTCSDTIANIPGGATSYLHTFSTPLDLSVSQGSVNFSLRVWVEKNSNDNTNFNDTSYAEIVSSFTPGIPNVYGFDTVNYGERAVLQAIATNDSLAWYDRNMQPLDTTNMFVSDYLYADDTFYVTSFGTLENLLHVGQLASLNNATAYPSPYNPNKKYIKEQYLFTAQDLIDAGHGAGPINSVSFYLDTIVAAVGTMTFTDYVVSIGTTENVIFQNNRDWQPVTTFSTIDTLTLSNSTRGWIKHSFDSIFIWDGVSNIVVQVTRAIDPNITQGARTRYTSTIGNRVLYKSGNSSLVNNMENGSRSPNRPDIRFGFIDYGCEGPAKPVYVTIVGMPPADAAMSLPDGSDTVTYSSCGNIDINMKLSNYGSAPITSYTVNYWIDNVAGSYTGSTSLAAHQSQTVTIAQPSLTPGRHFIKAVVAVDGDTVPTNDTVTTLINVRFCAGTYTIGSTGLFPDFTTAIDTLVNAGIDGPVVFSVQNGTYQEQLTLGAVDGSSATNTITFRSASRNSDDVTLSYAPANNGANYVLNIDGANFVAFEHITLYSTGNTFSSVVNVSNSQNVHLTGDVIRVKGSVNNVNANGIILGEGVNFFYLDSCVIDSGYCGLKSAVGTMGLSEGVYINNNTIQNFLSQGINMRKVNDVYVVHNQVRSGVNVNNRALTGIYIAEHNGPVTVERNNVVLSDNRTGGKQCIKLVNINGSNATRSHVYNNMAAAYGTATSGQTSCGIWIDSSSWINVYYNTCQVYAGLTNASSGTRAFSVETTSSGIYVMNNLFTNISRGYAFYVKQAANIGNTNYNNYWTNSSSRLAYWSGTECATFDELQAADNMDINSVHKQTYFISNEDLHLSVGTFSELAQYNTEVPVDIDDTIRPQIPNPCMGAHEFQRATHNVAVLDVLEPTIDIELGVTDNVESDPLKVKVKLMNDGTSTENNVIWWAEILNASPALTSQQRTITEIMPQEEIYDSTVINMPIGIIDTQYVVIHVELLNDAVPENNTLTVPFFLDPAYNVKTDSVTVFKGDGCRKQETPVAVNFKNVGRKPIAAGTVVSIGFQAVLGTTGVTVSTLPTQWVENATIPYDIEVNASATLNFTTTANLYPTGIHKDINVRCRSWVTHPYDQKHPNDTSAYLAVPSKFTPEAPVGIDLHIPYATWDTIFASETNQTPVNNNDVHRPIRWHRDSTAAPFFASDNYTRSCWWETPQYFHDSTYYLSSISNSGCTSYYSPVQVLLNSRVPVDMAVLNVVEPQWRMVYMLDDSVKISLINYGTQPVSNIPVVYQLFSPNNELLQEVREICPATIQPDQVYVYKFDSLLHIPEWSNNSYYIRTWTDMTNENVRLNDTLRGDYHFLASPDDAYYVAGVSAKSGLDITRVAFSSLDNTVAPVGFTYLNFANATNSTANIGLANNVLVNAGAITTPDSLFNGVQDYGGSVSMQGIGQIRALHVVKGTTDTMIVECANTDRSNDFKTAGWMTIFIDQDRDGQFYFLPNEIGDSLDYSYPYTEIVYHDSIKSNTPLKFPFTIPETIRTGYTRMRVVVNQAAQHPTGPSESMQFGQIQDYLLYVEDRPTDVDICAARIDAPSSQFIGGHTGLGADTAVTVRFRMANKGALAINSAVISYQFSHPESNEGVQTMQWAGSLDRGNSVSVALPPHVFPEGTTELMIVVSAAGDNNTANDTLLYQFHRSKVLTLIYSDQFEEEDLWFAPRGTSAYTQNVWQRGFPQKVNIMACVSDSNVWATNLGGYINTFQTGNRSIIYSPIIDITTIRADTMTLWVATDMPEGHLLNIEYCDYLGRWNVMGSANDSNWYNVAGGWGDVSSGYGYTQYRFPISRVSGNFQQYVRFRLVYSATTESAACDGAAIDNLVIGRQRRNIDASVIDIIYPTEPRFGQIINPTVVIYNHGYDTLRTVPLAYKPYGSHLPKTGTFEGELLPRGTAVYTFPTPFVVMNDFPDTFTICSFTTINMDMYHDNDTVCKEFYLTPLDNDMAMVSFLSPMQRVIAGDSIQVTTRLRNYGQAPVQSAQVTYVVNEDLTVTENIDFEDVLGHPLGSFEYFNYTFHDKFRATMGLMNLTAYVSMANDDYLFNDTIILDLDGISAITDLQATEIIVDTSDHHYTVIQLSVDNVGARAVSDFDVGFWYYNDTNRIVKAHVHLDPPLAALSRLYYRFDTLLPHHSELYRNVVAYVHVDGDNDMSNDTTTNIVTPTFDMMAVQIEVEENREEDCNVRLRVENIGSRVFTNSMSIFATINGTSIRRLQFRPVVPPGESFVFAFPDKVPKSPTRTYTGYARVECQGDKNAENDETSDIVVLNYFEPDGIPVAPSKNGMVLQQNYPNPFNNTTRIDFFLPFSGQVNFFVMDEMGRLVFQQNDTYSAGDHSIDFNDTSLPSGVYYYGIEMNGERLMRKMVLKR